MTSRVLVRMGVAVLASAAACNAILGNNDKVLESDAGDATAGGDVALDASDAASTDATLDGADDAAPSDVSIEASDGANDLDASADGGSDGGASADAAADAGCDASVCNGLCVDLASDDSNCGGCGYACVHGRHCMAGSCTPAWLSMSTVNAPTPVLTQGAALGGQLIIAGGSAGAAPGVATAAAYDPNTDTWTRLPDLNVGRCAHTVVSSGLSVYVFGGLLDCSNGTTMLGSLEQWKPGSAGWTIVSGSNPPAARYAHLSAWTRSSFLVYGGSVGSAPYVATGAVYDPIQNVWSDASCALPGCERDNAPAIVDSNADGGMGYYVHIWGGSGGNAPAGLQYEVSTGAWSWWTPPFPLSFINPADDGRRIYFPSGGGASNLNVAIYDRRTMTMTTTAATSIPNLAEDGAIAWVGAEVVLWSGGTPPTSAGGRYQPPAPQ